MKTVTLLIIVLTIVLAVSFISIWFIPSLQDFMIGNTMWNGINKTINILGGETIYNLNELPNKPEEIIIISVPYLEYSQADLDKMKQFVLDGGTWFIADDFGNGNQILAHLGVPARFNGKPLLDPLFCFRDPKLPKITDFAPDFLFKNNPVVVFNHATGIQQVANEDVLAWSSPTSYLDVNDNRRQDTSEPASRYPVAAKIRFGNGRIILASDPSILNNSMIIQDDNAEFVKALLKSNPQSYYIKTIYFDASHLTKTPLDVSKRGITEYKGFMAQPYPTLALLGIIFIVVSLVSQKTGGAIGRQQ